MRGDESTMFIVCLISFSMMTMNILSLLILMNFPSIKSNVGTFSAKARIIDQSRFEPPIDIHLIEIVNNIRSLSVCISICDRHIVCRTADYSSATKECRLFESLASAGTFRFDLKHNKSINLFNRKVKLSFEIISNEKKKQTVTHHCLKTKYQQKNFLENCSRIFKSLKFYFKIK